ncbi:MAG: hypothetical protein IKL95_01100 [Alphaproteobacteria bacterium]|nr:hypothetical protein [Alphaproteobacteria bacterium]
MKKVSYIGNDETTIFYFSFPYYEKSNIVVTVNGAAASGVEVVGNPGGINADFPFIGGHIAFDNAPGDADVITISRVLPLSRVVDYQQMVQIDPKTLNMDMNYIKQVLDDLNEELDEIQETTDTDKLNEVKQKIDAINERLDGLNNATASIGGINGIAPQINNLIQNPHYTVPDYSHGENKNWNTEYTATQNGILVFCAWCNGNGTGIHAIVNGTTLYQTANGSSMGPGWTGGSHEAYIGGNLPISVGDTYKLCGGSNHQKLTFFPYK